MLHLRLPTIGRWLCVPTLALALAASASAQDKIKIGAIYPLSGNAASAGTSAKAALEVAAEILNEDHPELGDLTLAKGAGLPGLKGAKVEIVFADNQGTPAAGQNQRSTPVVMQYNNGKTTVIWPDNIRTHEPVLPLPRSSPYAVI